jgi:hypothetical protein
MRQEHAGNAAEVAAEVQRYLREHPEASDTLIGVTKFWLNRDPRAATVAIVAAALDILLAHRVIERHQLPGGAHIYRRTLKS